MLLPENEGIGYRRQFRHFSTQMASAISQLDVDEGQWVGRLFRVYGSFSVVKGGNEEALGVSFGGEARAVQLATAAAGVQGFADEVDAREAKDRAAAAETERFRAFLAEQQISDLSISDVTYEIDKDDPEGIHYLAKGIIDIGKSAGKVLASGMRYRFQHRIKATYHTRETIFTEEGPTPPAVHQDPVPQP